MKKLLDRFEFEEEYMYAVAVAAVVNGHLDMVKLVMKERFDYEGELQEYHVGELSRLAQVAAEGGHVDIVDFLIPEHISLPLDTSVDVNGAIHEVLEAAAASGQLEVAKSLVSRTYFAGGNGNALTVAIAERQTDVALFLIGVKKFEWSLVYACETALDTQQDDLVELIYEAYVPLQPNWELFVKVAQYGNLNTVKYLYESGHNDGSLVSLAFEVAAEFGRTEIVTFLLDTGHISSNVFDRVVELIAASNWTYTQSTLTYLVKLKRASPVAVAKVFKSVARAGNTALVNFLYENEDIAVETVIDVFLSSASFSNDHQTQFVTSFYALPCISPEIIGKVFLSATRKGNQCVAKMLGHDTRLSIETFEEGFIEAAQQGDVTLVKALYKENVISNVVMLEAFTKAAASRNTTTPIQLAKYVAVRRNLPEDLHQKLFLVAAQHGKKRALEILTAVIGH